MKYIKVLLIFFIAFTLNSCKKDNNAKQLRLTFKDKIVEMPANVSIIFKVNDASNYPIPGLTESNFEIFEDGKLISEYEAARKIQDKPEKFKFNLLLMLDLSGSVLDSNLSSLKQASISFINSVMPVEGSPDYQEILMSVKWFDGEKDIHNLVDYTFVTSTLINNINQINSNISSDNSTNLYGGIIQGIEDIDKRVKVYAQSSIISAGALITFTDGTDQAGWYTSKQVTEVINKRNPSIALYSIGLGGEIDKKVLESYGLNGFEFAENLSDLIPKFEEIARFVKDEAKSYYLFEYCSPKRSGTHSLKIRVTADRVVGELEESFSAENFTGGCTLE
jgi:hypothetical protein